MDLTVLWVPARASLGRDDSMDESRIDDNLAEEGGSSINVSASAVRESGSLWLITGSKWPSAISATERSISAWL